MHDGLLDPKLMFLTDEAYFKLPGFVNSENNSYWSSETTRSLFYLPLYDQKVGVWYEIRTNHIIGRVLNDNLMKYFIFH
jgi:hypothetical protein